GRAPKLVPSGWVEPLRDTARRTFALALVTLLMLPLMWLATGLLPPPGGLAMGEQLRRLAYSREGPEGGPNSSMQRDQGSGEASAAGRSGDSSGTGQGGSGSEQSAEHGSPRDSVTESSREPGGTGEAGRPPETGDPLAEERGQGEPGDRPSEPERDTDPGQGQGSESPPASEGPTAGEEDGRQGGGQQSPSSGEEQPQPGSGKGGRTQPGESSQSEPGAGRREESSGQGESGQEGGAQGQGQSDGQGGAGQSNRESGQGQGSGQGDSGESRGDGFGRGGEDPQMDFDQPPIEVPELRPEDAVELDLPPMNEAVEPGQQPAQDPTDGRPAPAAASRDRNAPQGDQRPEKEAASQRLPNWIRALWDRLSETPPAKTPKEETGRPQPRPQERPPGGQAHSIRGGTPIAKHLRSFGLDFHEQTLS
ncbi:MAG TPA: hypothetical protein VLV83_17740, partial [Acidobacteriota bacterium]|nr:hypothetical protein [Acidobacteriota bacterium]